MEGEEERQLERIDQPLVETRVVARGSINLWRDGRPAYGIDGGRQSFLGKEKEPCAWKEALIGKGNVFLGELRGRTGNEQVEAHLLKYSRDYIFC